MKYCEGQGFVPEEDDKIGLFDEDRPCDLATPQFSPENTYYFSETGDDGNDGCSPDRSKRSLQEAERLLRNGNVRIALRGGDKFFGGLTVKTLSDAPVIVCGYGKGRPILCGGEPVLQIASSNVQIMGLEITDPQALHGIFVCPSEAGVLHDIVIEDCYVHDINFFWNSPVPPSQTDPDTIDVEQICPEYYPGTKVYWRYKRHSHGGIIFLNETDRNEGASWFENIFILHNHVENVARTGIYLANVWADKPGMGYGRNLFVSETAECYDVKRGLGFFTHKNVVCSENRVICAGGDGIILSAVRYAFMERNVCMFANYLGRDNYWNAGMWVQDAHDIWFRNNESACTYMRHGSHDSEGFDIDNACSNVVFKGNYSHHNEGGGLLVCNNQSEVQFRNEEGKVVSEKKLLTGRWYNNLICCNLFEENGSPRDETRPAFLMIAREVDYLFAYSNIVLMRPDGINQNLICTEDERRACYNHYYIENVFASLRPVTARLDTHMMIGGIFYGNSYLRLGKEIAVACKDGRRKGKGCALWEKRGWKAVRTISKTRFHKIYDMIRRTK